VVGELRRLVVCQAPGTGAPEHLALRLLLGGRGLQRVVIRAGHGAPEVAQAASELAPELGKPFRAEHEQEQPEHDEKLPDADSEGHGYAARNGFTAAVAWAAVSAFGKAGAGTIVPAAMFVSTLRWRDSFAPMVAATPFSSFDFSAVTAPR
jgi:hypothetical protein